MNRRRAVVTTVIATILIAGGCGGGTSGGGGGGAPGSSTFSISGTVSGAVVSGVAVDLAGPVSFRVQTDSTGRYAFPGLAAGSYTVTPSIEAGGCTFSPASWTVELGSADVAGQDFVGVGAYVISGTVSGATAGGVTVSLSGAASLSTTTDESGHYSFHVVDGTYRVTAARAGFIFFWRSGGAETEEVTVSGADAAGPNFTASPAYLGAAWSLVTTATWWEDCTYGTIDGQLRGISGSSADDVWAVGRAWNGGAMHWDGSAWSSPVSIPGVLAEHAWGSSATDFWAVGTGGSGTILTRDTGLARWNGIAWAQVPIPDVMTLSAVWGSSADDVWVSDGYGVLRWDGAAWSSEMLIGSRVEAIWGTGTRDVWAVGGSGSISRWDGSAWNTVESGTTASLRAIWGSSPRDVWAVGEVILHWNGSAWSSAPMYTRPGVSLSGIWGSAPDDVWAVGNHGTILHWDGSSWATASSGTLADLNAVWGSSANDVWAVGSHSTIVRFHPSDVATYGISGTVSGAGAAGVTISLTGSATQSTITDEDGYYVFRGLANGDYTVTPAPSGRPVSPDSRSFTLRGASVAGQDFTVGVVSDRIVEFTLPTANSAPSAIAAGPDGNLWFVETGNRIGRITTAGAFSELPLPIGWSAVDITVGPDGNMWLTGSDTGGPLIGRVTTPAGAVTGFPLNMGYISVVKSIATGPDGNLWFAGELSVMGVIGHITPAGDVATSSYWSTWPTDLVAGPDGNLWFTEESGNRIGCITPAGVITEWPLPASGLPSGIAASPDGNLWFTERAGNGIGRITPAGVITEWPLPTAGSAPCGIAAGPDGNLWFTERAGNAIGRITPAGVITEWPLPTAGSAPCGIAAGPDGNLWFTENAGNRIGRIRCSDAPPGG